MAIKHITISLILVLAASVSAHAQWGWSSPNAFGGSNYYGSRGMSGYSTPNAFGGHNYYSSGRMSGSDRRRCVDRGKLQRRAFPGGCTAGCRYATGPSVRRLRGVGRAESFQARWLGRANWRAVARWYLVQRCPRRDQVADDVGQDRKSVV